MARSSVLTLRLLAFASSFHCALLLSEDGTDQQQHLRAGEQE
jgi:hypothetical protein